MRFPLLLHYQEGLTFAAGTAFWHLAVAQVLLAVGLAFNSGTDTSFHLANLTALGEALRARFIERDALIEAVQTHERESFLRSVMGASEEPDLAGIFERFVGLMRIRKANNANNPPGATPIHQFLAAAQRNPGVRAQVVRDAMSGRGSHCRRTLRVGPWRSSWAP